MLRDTRKGTLDMREPFLTDTGQKNGEENDAAKDDVAERERNTQERASRGGAGKRNHRRREYRKEANFQCDKGSDEDAVRTRSAFDFDLGFTLFGFPRRGRRILSGYPSHGSLRQVG